MWLGMRSTWGKRFHVCIFDKIDLLDNSDRIVKEITELAQLMITPV